MKVAAVYCENTETLALYSLLTSQQALLLTANALCSNFKLLYKGVIMGEITKEEMRERLGNIDQIRDIIFGPQLRESNSRIAQIESDLSSLQQELRDRTDQVKMALSTELRAAVDSLEKKLRSVNLTAQEESLDLRQQLDRASKKFSNSVEALDQTVDKQTNSLRDELVETRTKLQEDVRTLREHIFEELERRFSTLRDAKVSRDDMAEVLFELGIRLKGTEVIPKLQAAANANGNHNGHYSEIFLQEQ